MNKGKLIIIESGSDGSGKATQTEKLYSRLKTEGYRVRKVTFPNYESESSALVKMYLRGDFGKNAEDVDPYTASTFFAMDRYASYKTDWGDFYESGGIVISDRYTTSNMVHQGAKMESGTELESYLDWLYNLEYKIYKIPEPDRVIFLDVDPEISQRLMKDRENKIDGSKEKDIHESDSEYLEKSYRNALHIAEKYSWEKVDCVEGGELMGIDRIAEIVYRKAVETIRGEEK